MVERLDMVLKSARERYKRAYEYELDDMDDIDMTTEQYHYVLGLRDDIMMLYWIKNEAEVSFKKSTIIVKWPNGEKQIY